MSPRKKCRTFVELGDFGTLNVTRKIDVSPYVASSRGGTRTRTEVTLPGILSPVRLPFRHSAVCVFRLFFGAPSA